MPIKKENKNAIDTVALKRVLKTYILPIVSMALFIGVVLLVIVPKVGEIFSKLDEIGAQNDTYNKAQTTLAELKRVSGNSNTLLAQLEVINNTTPTGVTEVVKFRDKITELTAASSLTVVSQRLSENNLESGEEDPDNPVDLGEKLTLQEVPFSFEIEGSYANMIAFINQLSVIDEFLIVREMSLSSTGTIESGSWTLKLKMNKYQFNKLSKEKQDALFLNVPITAEPSQNVLEYVNPRLDR